ncbi:recQ-mediated instability protein (DUF1767) isoform X1 [Tasmannia lanceolata]|uniref:recQ-mediated instability protein (DUF1767) isoform X1 n=1 Tax=Tasmannia lanceolata TaxID=3420 RepID=UPI004063F6AE
MRRRRVRLVSSSDEEENPNPSSETLTLTTPNPNPNPELPNPPENPPFEISDDDFVTIPDFLSSPSFPSPPIPEPPIPPSVETSGDSPCPVEDFLRNLGLWPKRGWLDSCISGLTSTLPGFSGLDLAGKSKLCFSQFLLSDMNYSGRGVLPENVHAMHGVELAGPFVLQVDEIVNISAPLRDRYRDAPGGIKRCLKLSLTDGAQRVFGMEYRPIKNLDVLAPAGLKISIHNVHIRRGLLMLVPEVLEVLGGLVEDLDAAKQRLVQEVNKPPRGKRMRSGEAPSLVSRARLAAWPSTTVNDSSSLQGVNPAQPFGETQSIIRLQASHPPQPSGQSNTFSGVNPAQPLGDTQSNVRLQGSHPLQPSGQSNTFSGVNPAQPLGDTQSNASLQGSHPPQPSGQSNTFSGVNPAQPLGDTQRNARLQGSHPHQSSGQRNTFSGVNSAQPFGDTQSNARLQGSHPAQPSGQSNTFSGVNPAQPLADTQSNVRLQAAHPPQPSGQVAILATPGTGSDAGGRTTEGFAAPSRMSDTVSVVALATSGIETRGNVREEIASPSSRIVAVANPSSSMFSDFATLAGSDEDFGGRARKKFETPSIRSDGEANRSSVVSDADAIHMVDEVEHPLILNGDSEVPFTYLASMLAKWTAKKDTTPFIRGKIKCFLTGVKSFQFKQRSTFELLVFVDDGSLISEVLVDHHVVQKGIGYSPNEVTAALSSSNKKTVTDMRENMKQYQLFLANFEGLMLMEINKNSSLPIALEMNQGCSASDAWLLLRRLKVFPTSQTAQHQQLNPINISP